MTPRWVRVPRTGCPRRPPAQPHGGRCEGQRLDQGADVVLSGRGGGRSTSGVVGWGPTTEVPVAQAGEALVEAHLWPPAQGGSRPSLVEPVGGRQLLGQEAGQRGHR